MSKKSLFKVLTETGPLIALADGACDLVGIAGPASAQFFNFPGFGGPPQRQAAAAAERWRRRLVRRRLLRAIPAAGSRKRRARIFRGRRRRTSATPCPSATCW